MAEHVNALEIARELIRCPSVTPATAGTLDVLERELSALGFVCRRYPFGEGEARVDNLYARKGTSAPNFCFAGHVDVVPSGDVAKWTRDPYGADVEDGVLWGRGAADMKGAIGAMVEAVARVGDVAGSISFLITADEEGPAEHGTEPLLKAIAAEGEVIDHCLVGEPTNPERIGTTIKNGRRGSFNTKVAVSGVQGHVAYPELALNPVPVLMEFLGRLLARKLDEGTEYFQPSNLEVTSIDVGNPAHNVIPEVARAMFNTRFNTEYKGDKLKAWIRDVAADVEAESGCTFALDLRVTGEAFITEAGGFTQLIQDAVERRTGLRPKLSTGGGTSDARYITNYADVVEFGLVGATMHKVDERVDVADIAVLTDIYEDVLRAYFGGAIK